MTQIVSGSKYAVLDPDERISQGFGEQIDFVTWGLMDKFLDECVVFRNFFGCDMRQPFRGTIIRVPLRSMFLITGVAVSSVTQLTLSPPRFNAMQPLVHTTPNKSISLAYVSTYLRIVTREFENRLRKNGEGSLTST